MLPSRPVRTAFTTAAAAVIAAAAALPAHAGGKIDASYTISVARIPIGNVTVTADIGDAEYRISASGRASGFLRVLASGEGTLTTRGAIKDNRPIPASFISKTTNDDDKAEVTMAFAGGAVTELTATVPPPSPDRVPLTDDHRRNVVDPLTAMLIPASDGGNGLTQQACQRTLPIFDGRRRFDLRLAFKRMDKVKTDKGYAGPIVVCSMALAPIAGHRASSRLVKYLSEGREMEIALAPIAGTRLLAPVRLSVTNMLGNLVLQANRFEALAPASVRASMVTGAQGQ